MTREFFQRVGLALGDFADTIFVAQHMDSLLVEYLKGRPAGVAGECSGRICVGIVSEIGPLIHEALPLDVHDDAERIGVFLVGFSYREVTEGRGVQVPGDGVAPAPVAIGLRSDIERHLDAVARVVRGAADFCEFQPGPR